MPSSTLKDQDKLAWSWAEFTDPNYITLDHVQTAYRIKQHVCRKRSCRRNCRGNPFCLSGLGEARLIESLNSPVDDASTSLPKRTVGSYVGLKNLGATCYVNSLLQLWFHNKSFRDAILSWNPLEDPAEQSNSSLYADGPFHPQTVVGHLQQLFALMYYSKCRYIDPSPLVESLRLDTSTQQDAQEFSKLFVSLLESALKHQSLLHVKNLISENFRGDCMYVTRCCKCLTESVSLSMFYELELNVKGHNTLIECLTEYLREEKLEGAECYSCAVCQTKQEACRFIKLRSLPPVLNLQLLRFVYDREKGQKKKLKSVVQFPEVLDMKDFVETDTGISLLYNLSAVLIHKGASASSGHFIAYIRDSVSGAWNTFNDESVEKLEGKKLQLDEEDSENCKKIKIPRLPKGFQSSTDAYMLVYTSEEHNPNLNEVQLSTRLENYVDSQNRIFDEFYEEIVVSKKQGLDRQEQVLNMYKCLSVDDPEDLVGVDVLSADWLISWLSDKVDVSQMIDNKKLVCPHNRLDPCAVTSAKYVSGSMADSLYDQYSGGPRLRLPDVLCERCVSNTCLVYRTKAKTLEESKEITNLLKKRMSLDEPGFYVDKYCLKTWRTKVLNKVEGKTSLSRNTANGLSSSPHGDAFEPVPEESSLTPHPRISPSHTILSVSPTTSTSKPSLPTSQTPLSSQTSLSVSETTISVFQTLPKSQAVSPSHLKTSSFSENLTNTKHLKKVECSELTQKRRQVNYALRRRRQSQTVTVPLSDIRDCVVLCKRLQMRLNKPSSAVDYVDSSLLNQCKKLRVKLTRLTVSPKPVKTFNYLRKNSAEIKKEKGSVEVVKKLNLEEKLEYENNGENRQTCEDSEKVTLKLEAEEGNKSDEGIDTNRAFNEAIMCPHGNLSIDETERRLVPVRVWEILKQYFPLAPSFSHNTEPCPQCQDSASEDKVVKQLYCESAVNQKKSLADLFHLRNRPVLGKHNDTIYILHKQYFYQPWSAFLKLSSRRDGGSLIEPPTTLKVDTLLCVHGLLHYSPFYEEDQDRLVLITPLEWATLISLYVTDTEVTVAPDLSTSPEICQSCFTIRIENEQKEKLNYERARLNIRQVPSASALEDSETSDSGSSKKRSRVGDEPSSPIPFEYKKVSVVAPADVRRSARNKKVRGQKDVHFTVSSSLTLKDLKQMITSKLAVAPFDQHLSTLDGMQLNGDFNTLSALGILPNSTLLLQVDEPKESFDDMMEECSMPSEPEAGFKGTGLQHAY